MSLGSSVAISATVFTGSSVSFIILLTLYAQMASRGNYMDEDYRSTDHQEPAPLLEITSPFPSTDTSPEYNKETCRKIVMLIVKRCMGALRTCGNELRQRYPDQESYDKHFLCVVKCIMRSLDLVDGSYVLTNSSMHLFLANHIPEQYRVLTWHLSRPCLEIHAPKLDPSDESCVSYQNFMTCFQAAADDCQNMNIQS